MSWLIWIHIHILLTFESLSPQLVLHVNIFHITDIFNHRFILKYLINAVAAVFFAICYFDDTKRFTWISRLKIASSEFGINDSDDCLVFHLNFISLKSCVCIHVFKWLYIYSAFWSVYTEAYLHIFVHSHTLLAFVFIVINFNLIWIDCGLCDGVLKLE